jgi:outer membrane protein assembly factor BamE
MMKLRVVSACLVMFLGFLMASCTPVKVQQGNLLPQSRIERLQVGMTKEQVARIMGTSLLMTPFSDNHWDYAYLTRVNSKTTAQKHLVLDFEGDKLTHISSIS